MTSPSLTNVFIGFSVFMIMILSGSIGFSNLLNDNNIIDDVAYVDDFSSSSGSIENGTVSIRNSVKEAPKGTAAQIVDFFSRGIKVATSFLAILTSSDNTVDDISSVSYFSAIDGTIMIYIGAILAIFIIMAIVGAWLRYSP